VHVWREEDRIGLAPPALEPGDHRVDDLGGVLMLLGLGPDVAEVRYAER